MCQEYMNLGASPLFQIKKGRDPKIMTMHAQQKEEKQKPVKKGKQTSQPLQAVFPKFWSVPSEGARRNFRNNKQQWLSYNSAKLKARQDSGSEDIPTPCHLTFPGSKRHPGLSLTPYHHHLKLKGNSLKVIGDRIWVRAGP